MSDKIYLRQLLHTAESYVDNSDYEFDNVKYFYRNKQEDYFREVRRNDNTLKKMRKDHNGDRRSPINGQISGVFLGVTLWQGRRPSKSPFGNTRVCFPIAGLFRDTSNLYFTDFYCTVSATHYVTLVLTTSASQEDIFCARSLIALDPENNMFFRRSQNYVGNATNGNLGRFTTVRKFKLNVEVFYTENVRLDPLTIRFGREHVFFEVTGIIGKGTSTWGGLRKKASCTICNPNAYTPEVTKSEAERMVTPRLPPPVPSQLTPMRPQPGYVAPRTSNVPALDNVGSYHPRTSNLSRSYGSSPSYSTFPGRYQYSPVPEAAQRSKYKSSSRKVYDDSSCCGKICCILM